MELGILKWIQSGSNNFWDTFFQAVTQFGEAIPLVAICLILYWTVNKEKGLYVLYSLVVALNISFILKDIFQLPRPIGQEGIRSLRVETAGGYAFPSGHTTNCASLWGAVAIAFRKRWLTVIAVLIIFVVGLSRLYLGVHYPKDVLGGLVVGFGTAALAYFLWQRIHNKNILYISTGILLVLAALWVNTGSFWMNGGLYWGFAVGACWESRFVNFSVAASLWRKLLRVVLGMGMLILLHLLLGMVLHGEPMFVFLHYFCIAFAAVGLYPMLFCRL